MKKERGGRKKTLLNEGRLKESKFLATYRKLLYFSKRIGIHLPFPDPHPIIPTSLLSLCLSWSLLFMPLSFLHSSQSLLFLHSSLIGKRNFMITVHANIGILSLAQ